MRVFQPAAVYLVMLTSHRTTILACVLVAGACLVLAAQERKPMNPRAEIHIFYKQAEALSLRCAPGPIADLPPNCFEYPDGRFVIHQPAAYAGYRICVATPSVERCKTVAEIFRD